MEINKAALDERQRALHHGTVVRDMESVVGSEIRGSERETRDAHAPEIHQVAQHLRGKAIRNVVETDREIDRQRSVARFGQFVSYCFYLVYGLLALRFFLALAGANRGAGFVRFINDVTMPLCAPFRGVLGSPATDEGMTFATPVLLAIVVYALLHFAIRGLLRVVGQRSTEI